MAKERLERVAKPWPALHRQSTRALLRAEVRTVEAMRNRLRAVVNRVVADVAIMGRPTRLDVLRLIKRGTAELQRGLEEDILHGRIRARQEAFAQLTRELEQVDRELRRVGIAERPLTWGLDESDGDEDELAAATSAAALSAAWGSMALAKTLAADTPGALAPGLGSTVALADYRIRRVATTEVARAYSDEFDEGVGYVGETYKAAGWVGAVFKIWNATLDRKLCSVCRGHDGEIVIIGFAFDGGDRPGFVHPHCRCVPSLVVIPARLRKLVPGHYVGLEEDDEAA